MTITRIACLFIGHDYDRYQEDGKPVKDCNRCDKKVEVGWFL